MHAAGAAADERGFKSVIMEIIVNIRTILAGIFLASESLYDIKTRQIQPIILLVSGILGIVTGAAAVITGSTGFLLWASGMLPGAFLLLTAKASREAVGYGDGLALMVTGMYIDVLQTFNLFILALFLSAMAAIVMIVIKRAGRKDVMPFLPFLFLGYCLTAAVKLQGG